MDATLFFTVKSIVGIIATALLVYHMNEAWARSVSQGQRLRYLTLLGFAVAGSVAAIEEASELHEVALRHWLRFLVMVLLVVTMVVSIREARAKR